MKTSGDEDDFVAKALELARRCNKLKEDNEVLKKEISDQVHQFVN